MSKQGVLLINLGSPDSPSVPDVRKYLREFLMDGKVLDAPWPIRFGIVHLAILPQRPKQSAHAYRSIWTADGSPLVITSKNVKKALQKRLPIPVELAMRYQNPTITQALEALRKQGVEKLLVIPLFPHYAMSSYESAVEKVKEIAAREVPSLKIQVQAPYYKETNYIAALIASAKEYLQPGYDHLLFSFHGIPERHLRKSDTTGCHCLAVKNCCENASPAHDTCYRAQCFQTMNAFVREAGIAEGKFSIAFQSRLGRDPWLKPYADLELVRLAKNGVKKLVVICPAFVSDCLETLEEMGIRGRDTFLQAGGTDFRLIPCLNENPAWIEALEKMAIGFMEQSVDLRVPHAKPIFANRC
ncbi:MAG: ferrochelatase [Verrucomicrobiales bacterium]|nr:ferrochelatase [Verrucomicrobiales bacterium]